jgi:protein-disulfide isomerase
MAKRAAAAPPPTASRRALAVALACSLLGVGVGLYLARLHQRAHSGLSSFCAISEHVNCDRVATSPYSVVLGLPVAVWGVLGFAALSAWGLLRRRPHAAWPAGLLLLASGGAAAASVALAAVSELVIGAFCILCAAAWTLAAATFVAAIRAARPVGAGTAVRADLAALRARPALALGTVALALAATAGAAAAYPRYWNKPARPAPAGAGATTAASAVEPRPARASGEPLVVEEFSDYDCPFCAQSFEKTRKALAGRTDVRLVHRHFPLDPSCNPALQRAIHPEACELARAGVCAKTQGRGEEMDALLFETQGRRLPPTELATRLGLDVPAFRACLASREAADQVAADVAAGIRLGVRATPTFVVDGVAHAGELPAGVLDAPR